MAARGVARDYEQEAWLMYLRYCERMGEERSSLTLETRHEIAAQLTMAAMLGRVALRLEKQ